MKTLQMFTPSVNRIYGNNLPALRESFQAVMIAMDGVQSLLDCVPEEVAIQSAFGVLIGCTYRHFENEVTLMYKKNYESVDSHIEKHREFTSAIEKFRGEYLDNSYHENVDTFRNLQRLMSVHLLMDDNHFIQHCLK